MAFGDRAISPDVYQRSHLDKGSHFCIGPAIALDIVDKMSPDDRAKLFDELPATVVRRLHEQLSPAESQATALLLGYEAGGWAQRKQIKCTTAYLWYYIYAQWLQEGINPSAGLK